MKPTDLLKYLVAGSILFATGYAFGSAADTIASLRKQPASMLTVGVMGANAALSEGSLTVESGRFVVSKTVGSKSGLSCPTELEAFRQSLGVRIDGSGARSRSSISRYFLQADEQNSTDAGVLARRDAIDEATHLRIRPQMGAVCEGPLVAKP